ncbi:LysR family transcriptional regulator [Escherichia coli]|nr:LysR family transcriptional regulator [Escherichia coli]EFG6536718.1 LysR family transcriptional regulator [Escherichia coli]EIO3925565.1 LysR family transcriptional regulator [Escherichia coli]
MFISDETLRVIHLVARHQSITTAAEQLNKVPSAISYTIKKAEESLGVEQLLKKPMREHKHATKLFLAARSDGMGKACQWCIEYLRNPQLMTRFVFN